MIAPDMATMLAFVFTDAKMPARRAAEAAAPTPPTSRSTASPSTATPRPATRCCWPPPARRAMPPIEEADDPVPGRLQARARRGADRAGAAAGRATARAPPSSSPSMSAARSPTAPRARSGWRSPTRRWSRRRSPARTPTGAASSWRSASRASSADRDKLRISIGGVQITDGGQVVPNYDETPVARHIKGTRHRDRHRSRHRPRPRHGLDLRPDARLHRHQRQLPFLSAS